jgi:hypothetical protein
MRSTLVLMTRCIPPPGDITEFTGSEVKSTSSRAQWLIQYPDKCRFTAFILDTSPASAL